MGASALVRVTSAAQMNLVCLQAELPRPATAAHRRARATPPPCADNGARRGLSDLLRKLRAVLRALEVFASTVHDAAPD
jgi:hypothetical protein